jgi:mRNA interferase MazF
VSAAYVPETGDLVWLTFDPQAGREQGGRRPALVLRVAVPAAHGTTGVILADHVKSVDWKARRAEKAGRCSTEAIDEVRSRLAPLLGY